MKLLTLNLHCFAEEEITRNQQLITDFISKHDVDVIFLQEVAQSETAALLNNDIRTDNYGLTLKENLELIGKQYDFHYMFGNQAFGSYQEGLAILSKTKLYDKKHFFISKLVDYNDWHTRVIVSCKTKFDNKEITLTSAHLGWTEGEEVFEDQIDKLVDNIDHSGISLLAGDFNIAAGSDSYDYVVSKGYNDLFYSKDKEFFFTPTHISDMDVQVGSNRIDYIFSNKELKIRKRLIAFSDTKVSDHFGVYLEVDLEEEKMISIKEIDLRYSDTDQMGVIYHANYLSFFEQARTQFYKDVGYLYHETEEAGVIFPVREVNVKYLRAIRLGEQVIIKTKIHEITKIKVTYYHEMFNGEGELKSKAYTTVVSVDKETFKTVKMSERLPSVYNDYVRIKGESK